MVMSVLFSECIHLQDPYCAWDTKEERCVARGDSDWNKKRFIQNVERGLHHACGPSGIYFYHCYLRTIANCWSKSSSHFYARVEEKIGGVCCCNCYLYCGYRFAVVIANCTVATDSTSKMSFMNMASCVLVSDFTVLFLLGQTYEHYF